MAGGREGGRGISLMVEGVLHRGELARRIRRDWTTMDSEESWMGSFDEIR